MQNRKKTSIVISLILVTILLAIVTFKQQAQDRSQTNANQTISQSKRDDDEATQLLTLIALSQGTMRVWQKADDITNLVLLPPISIIQT